MGGRKTCKQVILSIFATVLLQHTPDFINLLSCHGKAAVQTALRDSVTTFRACVTLRNVITFFIQVNDI